MGSILFARTFDTAVSKMGFEALAFVYCTHFTVPSTAWGITITYMYVHVGDSDYFTCTCISARPVFYPFPLTPPPPTPVLPHHLSLSLSTPILPYPLPFPFQYLSYPLSSPSSRWFEMYNDPDTGTSYHAYKGKYWDCKLRSDWSASPDIFWILTSNYIYHRGNVMNIVLLTIVLSRVEWSWT